MELSFSDMCFGCGKDNECGLQLVINSSDGKAEADVVFKEFHEGWKGIVHGGILAAAIDEVMAHALSSKGVESGVTAELTVRFKKPVKVGEKYKVVAEVVSSKGRKFIIKGEIIRDGEVYVKGEAVYIRVKEVRF